VWRRRSPSAWNLKTAFQQSKRIPGKSLQGSRQKNRNGDEFGELIISAKVNLYSILMKHALSFLAGCIAWTQTFAAVSAIAPIVPTLTGQVSDTNGIPLEGATVFIYGAGPRVGRSLYCPTCYPECRKNAVTGAKGEFKIEDLNPNLIFRLLVVNKSYRPIFLPRTDPLNGAVAIHLEPRSEERHPHRQVTGRVLDPEGKPINHAIVNFDNFMGDEANCGGQCEGVDLVSVTDENGHFFLASQKKFDWMDIHVEAPGFARKKFFRLSSEQDHELPLSEGAWVKGRVTKTGKPAANIPVGLVSMDRSENFTGNYDTVTDENGRFSFANIPPYQMYYIYSLLDSKGGDLVTPVREARVLADGTTRDLGDLPLTRGLRVHGRVILSDGNPIPPGTELYFGREAAWDGRSIRLPPRGDFDAITVPGESVSLSVSIPGYRLSTKNKSLDLLNGGNLVGTVDHDTAINILLEPGQFQRPDFSKVRIKPDMQPMHKPLEGIPAEAL
jgi:protocatechuate 3,4-dioxygenase beta subunit